LALWTAQVLRDDLLVHLTDRVGLIMQDPIG
jgi:hypothetical protein